MTIKYLLDTNIVSEPLRPFPNQAVLSYLRLHQTELAIAVITWHELWFGCYRLPVSAKRTSIELYLTQVIAPSMPLLFYDRAAAEWHAAERSRLNALGKTPPFADGQIAAIAKTNDLRLITINQADFTSFDGLHVETWHG